MKVCGSLTKPVDKASSTMLTTTLTKVNGAATRPTVMANTETIKGLITTASGETTNSTAKELKLGRKARNTRANTT
jgi:hypothetical protein